MIGVGITVICIKQDTLRKLEVGEEYVISGSLHGGGNLSFKLRGVGLWCFPSELFITLDEYRRLKILKLKKLCSTLVIIK